MSEIKKGNLNGISSRGGYWQNGTFIPNPVSETDPLHILYGYPVNSTSVISLEPGTKSQTSYEDDGHGVITSRVVYYGSQPKDIPNGATHPKMGALKCYRSSTSQDGKVWTTTAEYIGLKGSFSNVVFSGDFGVSTSPVLLNNYARSKGIFTLTNGWDDTKKEFIAMRDDAGNIKDPHNLAGTKSYIAPTLSISGFFFSTDSNYLSKMTSQVGKIFNQINLPSADAGFYNNLPASTGGSHRSNRFILTGVSHERIAHLYKIKFSILYSADGWHDEIYQSA